jgi:hypothetical protein
MAVIRMSCNDTGRLRCSKTADAMEVTLEDTIWRIKQDR